MIKIICTIILMIFLASAHGSIDISFNNELDSLYNFAPHTLSKKEIETKSKQLDIFWKKVTGKPNKYKQLIRVELKSNSHSPYFYYDGSKLLLSISDTKKDKTLVLKAIQKTDLKDIQSTDYLITVTKLGLEGFDTSDAAFHILSNPNFKAFIVQHALTLGQDYSLISMLIPLNQELYIDKAIKKIKTESDQTVLKSLLKLLWYSDTPEALKTIANIATDTKYSKKIMKLAKILANERKLKETIPKEKLSKLYKALGINSNSTYSELKKLRKKRFNRISDEALIELDQLTFLMKRLRVLKNSNN